MDKFELFKLCLLKYDELLEKEEKTKWFYKNANYFALINLEEKNFDLYKIHIVNQKSIYSFNVNKDDPKIRSYLDGYYPQEVIQVIVRENNSSIKFSGITGMSDFVSVDNLHRISITGHYHAARDNHPFWKTLFAKY